MDELKNFATLNQLMFKAATIYQKLGQLGSTKNNALNEMLELVQEMKVRLYAEWERFKPSNTSYFPQLKIK